MRAVSGAIPTIHYMESRARLAGTRDFTLADWEKATAAVLRKAKKLAEDAPDSAVWEVLTTSTLDHLEITPLGTDQVEYAATGDPGHPPFTRGTSAESTAWDIRSRFVDTNEAEANDAILEDLNGGVTSVWLTVSPDVDFVRMLEGVQVDLAAVVLEPVADHLGTARAFLDACASVDFTEGTNLGGSHQDCVAIAELALNHGVRAFVIDGAELHNQGATDAQELAFSMVQAVRILRTLEEGGIHATQAHPLFEFRMAATDQQIPTIAKFRAARRMWHRVGELSSVPDFAQRQHAVTSRAMVSKYDPYVNMLRNTIAAFSAGVGGADALTVLPFDDALGMPTAFSRRIARNTSHLLIDEAQIARVADPAGGSYVIEQLTNDLAEKAWDLFTELDAEGEKAEAAFNQLVERAVDKRSQLIAQRKMPLTGVSEFPNLAEERLVRSAQPDHVSTPRRYAEPFENMRDRPMSQPVFLATLGAIASHTARATFATNLFAAGGIGVTGARAYSSVADLISAYREAGKPAVVCLAGSDASYAEMGAEAILGLRQAGARHIISAGASDLQVDSVAALGMDAVEFLSKTRAILEENL